MNVVRQVPPRPVPAGTTPAGSITCRQCQQTNPGQRRFCSQCGASLWDTCRKCQAEISASERFCGQCGTDVVALSDAKKRELEESLAEAERLGRELRFAEAIETASIVAATVMPDLAPWAKRGQTLIAKLEAAQREALQDADEKYRAAQEQLRVHNYEHAYHLLDEIPSVLRKENMEHDRRTAASARKEVLELSGAVREAVESQRTHGLLPKLERLLTLKPNYEQARKLAHQLRDQLLLRAIKKLKGHEYQTALDVLQQIPAPFRDENSLRVTDQAEELQTLWQIVTHAALADEATVNIARKLVKAASTNTAAQERLSKLTAAATLPPAHPRLGAPNWTPPPKTTPFGAPVDWLGHFQRLRPKDEAANELLAKHPGQFFVALGLALQGIDQARVAIDLLPTERQSVLGGLSLAGVFRKKTKAAWGLDLSPTGLRAIKLVVDDKSGATQIAAVEFIPHSKPLTHPEAEFDKNEIRASTLRAFVEKHKPAGERYVASLPGQRVLGRFFDLPPMSHKKIPDVVQYEAKHQVPIAQDELHYAYHVQEQREGKEHDDSTRPVLLVAARSFHVKERIKQFADAGITLDQLATDAVALHSAAAWEFFTEEPASAAPRGAILLACVRSESTDMVISAPHFCWFRTIGLSGKDFTQALVKQLRVTFDQAESLKRNPAQAKRLSQMFAALRPLFVQFSAETTRTLETFGKLNVPHPVEQIYGLGGGFQTPGLLRQLRMGSSS